MEHDEERAGRSAASQPALPPLPKSQVACYAICFAGGLLGFAVAIAAMVERGRFNPIYKDIHWKAGLPMLNSFEPGVLSTALSSVTNLTDFAQIGGRAGDTLSQAQGLFSAASGGSLFGGSSGSSTGSTSEAPSSRSSSVLSVGDVPFLDITVPIGVWNPNPYHIAVAPQGEGSGYFVSPAAKIARAIPSEVLIPEGPGGDEYSYAAMTVVVKTTLEVKDLETLMSSATTADAAKQLLRGYIHLLFEYAVLMLVQPQIFGSRISVSVEQSPKCKVPVNLLTRSVEAPECADSWEDIGVGAVRRLAQPPVGSKTPQVSRQSIDDAQSKVNMSLGGLAVLCAINGVMLMAGPLWHYRRWRAKQGGDDWVDGRVSHLGSSASAPAMSYVKTMPSAKE